MFQRIEKEHIYGFLSHHLTTFSVSSIWLSFPCNSQRRLATHRIVWLRRLYIQIQGFPWCTQILSSRVCYWVSSLLKLIPFINSCLRRSFTHHQSRLIARSTIRQQTQKRYLWVPLCLSFHHSGNIFKEHLTNAKLGNFLK